MRVLQIVEPGFSGVFRHVEGLVQFLLQNHVSIDLAYSSKRRSSRLPALVRLVESRGGVTIDLKVSSNPGLSDVRALAGLLDLMNRNQYDAVHCHSSKAGFLGRVCVGLGNRIPCFYTPNAYFGQGGHESIKTLIFNTVERLLGGVGYTIHVSREERIFANRNLGINPKKQHLIPNTLDFDKFVPSTGSTKLEARNVLGIPKDAVVLGSLGRLSYQKDPLTLLRVFAELSVLHPNLFLVHLADGELAEEVDFFTVEKNLKGGYVRIAEMAEVTQFFDSLDGFLLTSRYEGLPFSVIEAFASNLPVVLTDCSGNLDFESFGFEQLWYGKVGDVDSIKAAVEIMREWINSNRNSSNREVAKRHFSHLAGYGKVLELYQKLIHEREDRRVRSLS